MKFFKVLPKEKSNLKSACKKISLAIVLKAWDFVIIKETPTQLFSCEYSKNFRNNFFYRTTPVDAFEWRSIRKEFLKKKVSGEITFDIITLFNVQIQEPTSRSPTTRAYVFLAKFAEFYYHKIFETRSWWQPRHYMDHYSNLITVAPLQLEIKRFVRDLWLWANGIIFSWVSVPNGTLSVMFTCYPILMFLASPWLWVFRSENTLFKIFWHVAFVS